MPHIFHGTVSNFMSEEELHNQGLQTKHDVDMFKKTLSHKERLCVHNCNSLKSTYPFNFQIIIFEIQ